MARKLERHGITTGGQPPEYQIWAQIKQRCYNKKHPKYRQYGGRGIKMDPRWRTSFTVFLADVGPRPHEGLSVERLDVDRGYFPDNCVWADDTTQARNMTSNLRIMVAGQDVSAAEAAEAAGLDARRVRGRLHKGMTPEEALARPAEKGTKYFTWQDQTHSLAEWCRRMAKNYHTVHSRIFRLGWSFEQAISE